MRFTDVLVIYIFYSRCIYYLCQLPALVFGIIVILTDLAYFDSGTKEINRGNDF